MIEGKNKLTLIIRIVISRLLISSVLGLLVSTALADGVFEIVDASYEITETDANQTINVRVRRTLGTGTDNIRVRVTGTQVGGNVLGLTTAIESEITVNSNGVFNVPFTVIGDNETEPSADDIQFGIVQPVTSPAVPFIITDDDAASYSFSSTTYSVDEQDNGTNNFAVEVNRIDAIGDETVQIRIEDGTATSGASPQDYIGNGIQTLNFTGTQTSQTFELIINGDTIFEPDETVDLSFLSFSVIGTTGVIPSAIVTIENDDQLIGFTETNYGVPEGDAGSTTNIVTLERAGDLDLTQTVEVSVVGGTATAGTDFTAGPFTTTFGNDATTATINIGILGDILVEGDEDIQLEITSVDGTANFIDLSNNTASLILEDDDASVYRFSSPTYSNIEGDTGTTDINIRVERTGAIGAEVLTLQVVGGDATQGTDYTLNNAGDADVDIAGSVINMDFGELDTFKEFSVEIVGDTVFESDETLEFDIVGTSANGAIGLPSTATLTIINDDVEVNPQTIAFEPLDEKVVLDPDFTVSATASSGLPVSFSSATLDICTVDGDTVSLLAVGICTINANQAGDDTFDPAPQVQQSFNVDAASQTITFEPLEDKTVFAPDFTVSATASSGLPVSFSSATPDVCIVNGSSVSLLIVGDCTINADQAGDGIFDSAPQVQRSFDITTALQTINFAPIEDSSLVGTTIDVTATASSGLPVSFNSATSDVCTVAAGMVSLNDAGICTIIANQVGNTVFSAAPQVQQSFIVTEATQTITFEPLADKTLLDADVALAATASSDLPISFGSATPDVCTVTDDTVSLIMVGICTINADQAGDATFEPAPQIQQSFNITAASQTISFDALTNRLIGSPDVTLSATASSDLPVSFSSATPNVCTVTGDAVSLVEIGVCTINADQAGNAVFAAAPQVQQSFTVSAPANVVQVLPGVDLGEVDVARGQTDVSLLSFQLVLSEGSVGVTLDSVSLVSTSFAGINRAESLRLYIDDGTRGTFDSQDVLLATLLGNNVGQLVFNFSALTLQPELPVWILVVGDF